MTLFDLSMINTYRSNRPTLEDLVKMIAIWAGAYKPSDTVVQTPSVLPPDPRAVIRAAFKSAKFKTVDEVQHVEL